MLILDKSRALDLMVAQASRAPLPEEFSLEGEPASVRSGFRVATYGPIRETHAPYPAWHAQGAPTSVVREARAPMGTPALAAP